MNITVQAQDEITLIKPTLYISDNYSGSVISQIQQIIILIFWFPQRDSNLGLRETLSTWIWKFAFLYCSATTAGFTYSNLKSVLNWSCFCSHFSLGWFRVAAIFANFISLVSSLNNCDVQVAGFSLLFILANIFRLVQRSFQHRTKQIPKSLQVTL